MEKIGYKWCQFVICGIALAWTACGGGPDSTTIPYDSQGLPGNWESTFIAHVDEIGSTLPFVRARQSTDKKVHIAWYNAAAEQGGAEYHQLHHLVWNPSTDDTSRNVVANRPAPTGVLGFDRCDQFDMALDGNTPILIYPTYEINDVLQQVEADIMVNVNEGGVWQEAMGSVGFVDRNPVYQDGHITENMAVKIDRQGDIHYCYQYFTEGMDSANYRYPDLYYVHRDRSTLSDPIAGIEQYAQLEELVDGNAFSSYGTHNSVGYHNQLLLDGQDLPIIAYAEHGEDFMGTFALKVAKKDVNGRWHLQTVDALPDGWEIGGIGMAFYPEDPERPEEPRSLGIAYAVRLPDPEPDNGHRLLFASNQSGEWKTEVVDESTWCGTHCSLAFTQNGQPAIAYLDEQSHSGRIHRFLKYAEFNGLRWNHESAEEYGDVGQYNTLWFDDKGIPHICTFSAEDNEILVVRRSNS
jgi:hypothetical protein